MTFINRIFWNASAVVVALGAIAAPIALAPSASAQEHYSNYYVPGEFCVFDTSGAGMWLCSGGGAAPAPRFVAIAVSSSTLATGSAWGFPSQQAAEQRAMQECAKSANDCKIADWAYDQCLALAVSPDGSWGVDRAAYVDIAEARALKQCNNVSSNCVVKIHPCSGD